MIGISERQALFLYHVRSDELIAAADRHRRLAAAARRSKPRQRRWRLSWPGWFTLQVTLSTGRPDYT